LYPGSSNTNSIVSGVSSGSQVIEIVMDEEEEQKSHSAGEAPAPPQPPFARESRISHSRGRSETDNSISSRFSRAAERLRSASRGRNVTSPTLDRTRSPLQDISPYESVPAPWAPAPSRSTTNTPQIPSANKQPSERHPREIKAAMAQMEGGMF
jgi:hypothetical protein